MKAFDLLKRYNNEIKDDLIFDLREKNSWDIYHLPNAINIKPMTLINNIENLIASKEQKFYVVCYTGKTSIKVMHMLNNLNYNVINIEDGMQPLTKKLDSNNSICESK